MSALEHDSESSLHPGWIVLPHAAIALVNWGNIILSLNKFRGLRAFTPSEYLALLILMVSALVGGVTSLATRTSQFYFQLAAAFVRALMTWAAFVLVFNGSLTPPTVQQGQALVLALVSTGLWEVINRMMVLVDV